MGRKAQAALLPVGCALILLGVVNHVALHLNVNHFAEIVGVLALICIGIGGWAALGELGIGPAGKSVGKSGAAVAVAAPVSMTAAAPARAEETPVAAPVAAGSDDETIQA